MRTIRFRDPAGTVRTGRWDEAGIEAGRRRYTLDEVQVLAPSQPTKIVCVGLNYRDHAEETGKDLPDRPQLFLKPPSAVSHHGAVVRLPGGKERLDPEAELAVVMARQASGVLARDAMAFVAGYTCMDDLSNRDDQEREQNWVRGKAFDNAAPLGPVLASPEEVPADARIELSVNGQTRQSSTIDELIFTVPELIEEITRYLTLEPGDVIATGTPAGVRPLADGDQVAIEIEGIGRLEHGVEVPKEGARRS